MKIEKIIVAGFKCFNEVTEVYLNDFNGIIGNNGVGKTAILEALSRCFDIDSKKRGIKKEDFYVKRGETLEQEQIRKLSIDIYISFTKLEMGEEEGIPEFFNYLFTEDKGEKPKCRIRLEAIWNNTNASGGDIDESIFFVNHSKFGIKEEHISGRVTADIRSKIRVHYIPAMRNPEEHMKQSANSILYQLVKSVNWSSKIKEEFIDLNTNFNNLFKEEKGISIINEKMSFSWSALHNEQIYNTINISPLSNEFDKIISRINATFSPTDIGGEDSHDKLSDGMKSLFYFTLIKSMFDIENEILKEKDVGKNEKKFNKEANELPYLSIFAIEEPENHLAPHNFGKIMNLFRELLKTERAQILLTSHSPSIIKRIEPEEVIYILQNRTTGISQIKKIVLPNDTSGAFTYVKEGIKAYPELYFSKLVVLGEGDSEELVIPKIAKAFDLDLEYSYISIVPLGGRHVNHFWKLLNDLNIPHITLLDYDRGRGGGDWKRIEYAIKQLVKNKRIISDEFEDTAGNIINIKGIGNHSKNIEKEEKCIEYLKKFDVYFSYPIDLDYSMLKSFPKEYTILESMENGPQFHDESSMPEGKSKIKNVIASVLKKENNEIENIEEYEDKDVFEQSPEREGHYDIWYWYRYLFLGKGKPISHMKALKNIENKGNEYIKEKCSQELKDLIGNIKKQIGV